MDSKNETLEELIKLRKKLNKLERTKHDKIFATLIILGLILAGITYKTNSYTLAIISLGLIFYSLVIRYTLRDERVDVEVLTACITSYISTLKERIGRRGRAIHYPKGEEVIMVIPKTEWKLPRELEEEEKMIPPGEELYKTLKRYVKTRELEDLVEALPDLLTNVYKLALTVKADLEGDTLHVILEKPVFAETCEKAREKWDEVCFKAPCPFCSAIACLTAYHAKNPVRIEEVLIYPKAEIIELWIRILR